MSDALERALARFRRREDDTPSPSRRVTLAEFRAATEERLRGLEREMSEVTGRVNGLIFVLAGAVAVQVLLRLLE